MKKFLKGILCTALALTLTVGIGGCFVPVDENSVNLLAISASDSISGCSHTFSMLRTLNFRPASK